MTDSIFSPPEEIDRPDSAPKSGPSHRISDITIDLPRHPPQQDPDPRPFGRDQMDMRNSQGNMSGVSETFASSTISGASEAFASSVSDSTRGTASLFFPATKLLCREEDEDTLFRVYQKVRTSPLLGSRTQLVMIHGVTGVGKTALANSLRDCVREDGGYFVSGKFDQNHPEPNYAYSTAFAGFCAQVSELGEKVQAEVKKNILENVGGEAQVLTNMIPELENILGVQDTLDDNTQNREAVNRFNYVFRLFLECVASPDHPLVLFLDDMHWADESSLDLFFSLVNNAVHSKGILFLCTARDDTNTEQIGKQLNHVSTTVEVTRICLKPFTEREINVFMSSILKADENKTMPLTIVVLRQTKGKIFFIVELLRFLEEEGMLRYEKDSGAWTWDNEEIGIEFNDARDLVKQRVLKLSDPTRELLKIAACLGSTLDEEALGYLIDGPVFKYLREANERQLVEFNHSSNCFVFSHDCIKEVVYHLIPASEREPFHCDIGRRLWRAYPSDHLFNNNVIFLTVGQLILGCSQLKDQRERSAVAKLCLHAGLRATHQSSFVSSYNFLMKGIQLLGARRWFDDYQLCLALHNFAAEIAYCTANFDSVFHLVGEIMEHAKNFEDTLAAQATYVYALGSSGNMMEAIDQGTKVLQQLGVEFPEQLGWGVVDKGLKKIKNLLKGKSEESLQRLPLANDPIMLSAMQLLNLIFVYTLLGKIELAPLIGFKMIEITLEKGACPASCVGFVAYAMVLCGMGNDIDEGYRIGKLALKMHEQFKAKVFLGRVAAGYYGCVHGWKRPVVESLGPIKEAYQVGIECGDMEFAMINANIYCWSQLDYTPLERLDRDIATLTSRMKFYGQETALLMIKPFWQLLNNHMGRARKDPRLLIGDIWDETKLDTEKFPTVKAWTFFHRMMLSYFIGDYDFAYEQSLGCEVLISHPLGAVDVAIVIFFSGLTNLAMAGKAKKNRKFILKAEKDLKRISFWAKHSPLNFLGKQFLLEAELALVKGDHFSAHSKYTCAVALSREASMPMQTALSNERAARYFLSVNDKEMAYPHLKESVRLYKEWGGKLKLDSLTDEFSGVFQLL